MVNATERPPSPPRPPRRQLPTPAELDAYHAAQAELRAAAQRLEYLRQFSIHERDARPDMKNRVASLRRFPRILIHIDDLSPYMLQANQDAPPRSSGMGLELAAYIWRTGSNEPLAVAYRRDFEFEPRVDRGTHGWPDPRLAEDWLMVWRLSQAARDAGITALNQPGVPRPVRWEKNEERFERALCEYRDRVSHCPRYLVWIEHDEYSDRTRNYECALGTPCDSCKSHPAAPWYQPGEKWRNQLDAHAPSPPASPTLDPIRIDPAPFDIVGARNPPARMELPAMTAGPTTVRRTGPARRPVQRPGFDWSDSDDDY
ncbi:hypothetical protein EXIGLDRAFT_766864 [Exidia glandulosa HHB12029]|uniref:Uncharacterized protein n=1 Tax=Exidia glandulosa HHB12029 TaxID=1314781 RepID=A0A165JDU3_EXIGL|nr:hypothetical protein EXIGLDRAFT_766864 [Exidia glandulosa HHB12029]